jgi:hypothetical protein
MKNQTREKQLILLAVSNLRFNETVIARAIELASESKKLIILFVNDSDFTNCSQVFEGWFVNEGLLLTDKSTLKEHEKINRKQVNAVEQKATLKGIRTRTVFAEGDFAVKTLGIANKYNPAVIVTTRMLKYKWMKYIFGSRVDSIIKKSGSQVIEV